ncbi:MAG: type II toxin-antitoxin system VapC family toxin [Burkholderiales bacterium]|nr:type II toxin-antitoxin system VapC family toxin [Burkholderiales bacterium]
MKLLLDTHCLLWALTDAPELDAKSRRVILDAESVWFSEASIWELGLKWRKGKIGLQPRRVLERAQCDGFLPMPITIEAILVSSELRQKHGDPFDRLLYAQARTSKCALLSIDRELATFGSRVLSPK